ncbi:hypothetical protein NQ318_005080 [Aromia moschata]|uniref:Uncharacterized protein n=1 Tax=Aromia moschata TaxID=1265417 RepID=A0AAV8YFU6_9CUCU|nr:hypothetical protein NQ318_005080 [Aromia moschata]
MAEQNLIRKRSSLKARLTAFEKYLDTLTTELEGLDQITTQAKFAELEQRISRAEQIITDFDSIQNELECIVEKPEEQYIIREDFESRFCKIISSAKSSLSNFHKQNIKKIPYLRASLEGTAAQVIKSIQVTSDNYNLAWGILCERFDNKRLLVQNHVRALFNLENIPRESSSKIRLLLDEVSKHLRSLKQLGEQVDSWDTLIIYIVTSKLDNYTAKEWEKHKSDVSDTPTLQNLKNFLKNRADLFRNDREKF